MQIDSGEKEWVDFVFCFLRFTQRRRKNEKLRKVREKPKFNTETFENDPFASCRQNSSVRRQASTTHGCFGSQRVSRSWKQLLEIVIIQDGQVLVENTLDKQGSIKKIAASRSIQSTCRENLEASEEREIHTMLNFYRV